MIKTKRLIALLLVLLLLITLSGCVRTGSDLDLPNAGQYIPPEGQLQVHYIDVGQGDAILIRTDTGSSILIDAGERDAGSTVVNYLQEQGVDKLDLIVGTHAHSDHIGGLIEVINSFPVAEVLDSGALHTTVTFSDYLDAIDDSGAKFTEARTGLSYNFGPDLEFNVVHPALPLSDSLNNTSVVIRIVYGNISFLFAGDAEQEAEAEMLERGENIAATILKQPHHGSSTSCSPDFFKEAAPEAAIIMCGADNSYGHPHAETIAKLEAAGVQIYRTDMQGTIVVSTDGSSFSVNKAACQPSADLININTAGYEQLQHIIHIGPGRAEEIIGLRPFASVDELIRVTGIGPAVLEDIKAQGLAFVD